MGSFHDQRGFKFHVNTHRVIPILVVEEINMSFLNVCICTKTKVGDCFLITNVQSQVRPSCGLKQSSPSFKYQSMEFTTSLIIYRYCPMAVSAIIILM